MAAPPREARAPRSLLARDLIGRDGELRRLTELFEAAKRSSGTAAIITGEAGIGKSALLRVFAAHVRRRGARVLVSECNAIGARRPFGPFVQMIEDAVERWPAIVRSLPTSTRPLGNLVPALLGRDATSRDVPSGAPTEAIMALLRSLARTGGPMVLEIDDLHWADESTLELVPLLATRVRDLPVLLVMTTRSDDADLTTDVKAILSEIDRTRAADEIPLRPLGAEDVAKMAGAILGGPVPRALREALTERSDGSPFFVEEILRALAQSGELLETQRGWDLTRGIDAAILPRSIRRTVELRLTELSEEARRILRVAAVLGMAFRASLVARVAEVPAGAVLDAIRAGVRSGLLQSEQTLDHRFRHALTRDAILAELSVDERRVLHAAAGSAIEALSEAIDENLAEELAYHFDEAGDRERAFRYRDQAGRMALHAGAIARARVHLTRALALAPADHAVLGDLELRRAGALSYGGIPRYAASLEAADAARRHFERAGNAHGEALAITQMAYANSIMGQRELVWEWGRRAEAIATAHEDDIALASVRGIMAREAMLARDDHLALELGESALELIGPRARQASRWASDYQVGDPLDIYVQSLNTVGVVQVVLGNLAGADLIRRAVDLSREHQLAAIHRALGNMAVHLIATGGSDNEIRDVARELVEINSPSAWLLDGLIAFWDGDWDRAEEVIGLGISADTPWVATLQHLAGYMAVARTGRIGEIAQVPGVTPSEIAGQTGLKAQIHFIGEDFRQTLEQAEAAEPRRGDAFGEDEPPVDVAAVCALEASRRLGDDALAQAWELRLVAAPQPREPHSARGRRAYGRAARAAREGDVDSALALFNESLEHFSHLGSTVLARTLPRLRRMELLVERPGGRRAAEEEFAAVVADWRRVRADWYLERLREWGAACGVGFPADRPWRVASEAAGLTRREREVADLVAGGLTNKEIAEKLVVGERTVESHVQHVLGKLGFRSRAQIAAWVERERARALTPN